MLPTIVALATPPGKGALHVIRMSGSESFRIINQVAMRPVERTQDRLQINFIGSSNGQPIDQVVISKYYEPYSYTGEDCIEISCHGNGLISKLIIDELIKHGAVYAKAGEFTKRAYLNGKIDLNQAINIGLLFESKTELEVYTSARELQGTNSRLIRQYLDQLFAMVGECELNIDYPREIEKEDEGLMSSLRSRISALLTEMQGLLTRSRNLRLSNYRVVFIGKPNAGKSSLVNHLIGEERIIVSNRAGTTQDPIEVEFYFEGYMLTLVDTAGIDGPEDLLKYEAAKRSQRALQSSDLVIYLKSPGESSDFFEGEIGGRPCIEIITKSDLMDKPPENSISVKDGNLSFLLDQLKEHLRENYSCVGIKSKDNINHLHNACEALTHSLEEGLPLDLLCNYLHESYDFLGLILGSKKTTDEKINMLFDGFCVGK